MSGMIKNMVKINHKNHVFLLRNSMKMVPLTQLLDLLIIHDNERKLMSKMVINLTTSK
jgi:hypothetical protein